MGRISVEYMSAVELLGQTPAMTLKKTVNKVRVCSRR